MSAESAPPSQQRCLMDVAQTSEYMNVAVHTLNGWRVQRRGPAFIRAETKILYDRNDVDAFLAAGRTETISAA